MHHMNVYSLSGQKASGPLELNLQAVVRCLMLKNKLNSFAKQITALNQPPVYFSLFYNEKKFTDVHYCSNVLQILTNDMHLNNIYIHIDIYKGSKKDILMNLEKLNVKIKRCMHL